MRTAIIFAATLLSATAAQAQYDPYYFSHQANRPLAPMNGLGPQQQQIYTPPVYTPPTTWTGRTFGDTDYWHSNNGQSFNCRTFGDTRYCH